jgi:hypothetical protein
MAVQAPARKGAQAQGTVGKRRGRVSKDDETPKTDTATAAWTGAAALAGAAIGSAAVAAALLYASRRRDREEKKNPTLPLTPPETD